MTDKVIAVFGAGPGLGIAVARRFGREGYKVALIARRLPPLEAAASELGKEGITAAAFSADFEQEGSIKPVIAAIKEKFGRIDAIYYAPASTESMLPAFSLEAGMMRERMQLGFLSLIDIVGEVLPHMQQHNSGAILAAFGGTAAEGQPYMSGLSAVHAATRNYLFSLHGEVAPQNIHVGTVSINGVIKNSAYHQSVEAGESDAPEDLYMPMVDPDDLAEALWQASAGTGQLETFFPPNA